MNGTVLTRIDDGDPTRVTKTGKWGKGGDPNEYGGTLSYSVDVGDSMKVKFNGSFIAVFGLFDSLSEGVVTNYSVDGAPPAQATTPPGAGDTLRQQLWIRKGLAFGQHTLDITMAKTNKDIDPQQPSEGSIWFDYFLVDDPSLPSSIQSNSIEFPQPSSTYYSPSSNGGLAIPPGAIVGIVIGGLLLLLGAGYIFFLWYRMRRDAPPPTFAEKRKSHVRHSSVEPFLLSRHAADPSASSSHIAAASSSERLTFDPNLLIRGLPPLNGRKSSGTIRTGGSRDHDSRPPTARSRVESLGQSSTTLSGGNVGLPPGAQPPVIPPVPLISSPQVHNPQRPTTAHTISSLAPSHSNDTTLSHQRSERPESLHIEIVPPSEAASLILSEQGAEESSIPTPPPRQHVDSGVRAPDVILAHSTRIKRVELPPVYSPI